MISDQLFTLRYELAQPRSRLSAGAIAGIAISGVAGLFLIAILFLLLRAHRRRARAKSTTAPSSTPQPFEDNKPDAMFGGANRRPVLEAVSSYVGELPSPPPGSPPPSGKWPEGSMPPRTPGSVRSLWSGTSELGPDSGEPIPPMPTMELPGSTYLYEHHPAFSGHGNVVHEAAVEKGDSEETGIAK